MKTRRAKTILSILLTFALVLGLMTTGYAAPEEEPVGETATYAAPEEEPAGGTATYATPEEKAAEGTTGYAVSEEKPVGETSAEGTQSEEAATGNTGYTEYKENTEDAEDTEGAEDTEDTENAENTVDTELTEEAEPETDTADSDTDSDADAGIRLFAAEPEVLSEEAEEEDPEDADPEIQVFAASEGEQDLIVTQEAEGTIGEDVSFPYHIYQITEAEETITNMSDVTASEAGADLDYVICDADGKEISSGTTDAKGSFALTVGQSAQFTLEAGTSWYVYQDAPEAYPLLSVESDGDYAGVVDSTNGVVYYGQIEPVITGLTVTSDMEEADNTKTYDGEKITLTAEVSYVLDGATVSYQWYKDGVEIGGATDSTCVLAGNASDSGTYKCVVTVENNDRTASAEAEITITINKAAQDISYGQSVVTKTGYEDDFTMTLTTNTKVAGQVTYASSDETVATIDPETGKVHIVGPGYATITATAAETDNYEEGSASYVLIVNTAELDWEIASDQGQTSWDEEKGEWVDDLSYTGDPLELEMTINLTAGEQEKLEGITYQWYRYNSGTQDFDAIEGATGEACTLEGDDVNAGDYLYLCVAVVTYQNGTKDTVYGPIEVIIEKAEQNIEFKEESLTAVAGDTVSNEIAEEDSVIVGTVTFASSDESIATVDQKTGEVTIVGVGTVTITATAAETDNYNEASADYTITALLKLSVTVTSGLEDNTIDYDGETVTLEAAAETFPEVDGATYTYLWEKENDIGEFAVIEDETEAALTLEGNVADSGTYRCTVTVTYADDADSVTASDTIEITIEKAEQSIVFEEGSLTAVAGDTVTNGMTKDSVIVGTVTYSSSDGSIATVDKETGEVTIVGVGTVTITATAAETDNYNAASADYTITALLKLSVTVTSDMEEEDNTKDYDGKTVTLEVTAGIFPEVDGATYTYQWYQVDEAGTETEITDETEATLTLEGNVADSGTYRCTVTVTYADDAEPVTASGTIEITIGKAPQDISFEETEMNKTNRDEPFTNELTETKLSTDEGAGITYVSSDETVASVDKTTGEVTIVDIGETTITATAAETENFGEASASYTIVVTEYYDVKYAVSIYGIQQDVDEKGNKLGLTFGPATGASYLNSYKAHLTEEEYEAGGICLHWMSWEEIIEQSAKDPTAFEACLTNGCTHAVYLELNDTLLNTSYTGQMNGGDGAGLLFHSIKRDCRRWNSDNNTEGGWPASLVRTILNGKDELAGNYAKGALEESECLFSCFPSVLQDAIVAKAVKSDTVCDDTSGNNVTTYDRLWLFSGKELYGDSGENNNVIRANEGELYQRSMAWGITTTSNYGSLVNYDETGTNYSWFLRSQDSYHAFVSIVYDDGRGGDSSAYTSDLPMAFGFCLK